MSIIREKQIDTVEGSDKGMLFTQNGNIDIVRTEASAGNPDSDFGIHLTATDPSRLILNTNLSISNKDKDSYTGTRTVAGIKAGSSTLYWSNNTASRRTVKVTHAAALTDLISTYGVSANTLNIGSGSADRFLTSISVTSGNTQGGTEAAGLFTSAALFIQGTFAGNVTVSSKSSTGYASADGFNTAGQMNIGTVTGAISAQATGKTGGSAIALYAKYALTIGDLNGKITCTVTTETAIINSTTAIGLESANSTVTVNGSIRKDIVVTATATDTDPANFKWMAVYGISGYGGIEIKGNLAGKITVTATTSTSFGSKIAGLYSELGKILLKNISGDITVKAGDGNFSAGIYASSDIEMTDLAGNITVTSAKGLTYGLRGENITISGAIRKNISVTATSSDVWGIYSRYTTKITTQAGNISARTTNKSGTAHVRGIEGTDIALGTVTGAISAQATGKTGGSAIGLNGNLVVESLNGKITSTLETETTPVVSDSEDSRTVVPDNQTALSAGIYAEKSVDVNGSITKDIVASAKATDPAGTNILRVYGIRGGAGGITVKDKLAGNITVTATGSTSNKSQTAGIYAETETGSITLGTLSGSINVTAGKGKFAAGIYAEANINAATLAGKITVRATDSWGYGLATRNGNLTFDTILGAITVSATSAYGISANSTIDDTLGRLTIGELNGAVSVTSTGKTGGDAIALHAQYALTIGELNGKITCTVTTETAITNSTTAYGLESANSTVTVNGSIRKDIVVTTTATDTDPANFKWMAVYGISGRAGIEIKGNLAGKITVTATTSTSGGSEIAGLYSESGSILLKNISGDITVKAGDGNFSAGIYASSDIKMTDLAGKITVTSAAGGAYGLRGGDITISGAIRKNISVTTNSGSAYGILGAYSLSINTLAGNVVVKSNTRARAFGINSNGKVTLDTASGKVTVLATSTADTGTALAAAYSSAFFDSSSVLTSGNSLLIKDKVSGGIQAEASGAAAKAYGYLAYDSLEINALAGKSTVSANGRTNDAYAAGLYAFQANLTLNSIAGDFSVTAKGGANAEAYGACANALFTIKKHSGKFTVSATGTTGTAKAWGFSCSTDEMKLEAIATTITVSAKGTAANAYGMNNIKNVAIGSFSGKLTVSAIGTTGTADAVGINSSTDGIELGTLSGSISVAAEAATNATAYGINAKNVIAGSPSVPATLGVLTVRASGATGSANATGLLGNAISLSNTTLSTITVTAKSATTAEANGLYAKGASLGLKTLAGKLTVEASSSKADAKAYGIRTLTDDKEINIGTISNDIRITAKGTTGTDTMSQACGLYAESGSIKLNALAGKLTVEATSSQGGTDYKTSAYGFYGNDITLGTVSRDILVKSVGINSVNAGGIHGSGGSINITALNGALTVQATSAETDAYATAIGSTENADPENITIGTVTRDISVTARSTRKETIPDGKTASAFAYGIDTQNNLTITALTGNLSVSAFSQMGSASAGGVGDWPQTTGEKQTTIGTISKNITVQATGFTNADAFGVGADGLELTAFTGKLTVSVQKTKNDSKADPDQNGLARAYGFCCKSAIFHSITGSVNVSANGSRTESETQLGIPVKTPLAEGLYVENDAKFMTGKAGTWVVNASGNDSATAIGWNLGGTIQTSGVLTGKLTVTSSGTATGISTKGILGGNVALNLTVNGKTSATAYRITGDSQITFENASIVCKADKAADAKAFVGNDTNQNIQLTGKTSVAGSAEFGGGANSLTLTGTAKMTGASVVFGTGDDTLTLDGRSTLTADVDFGGGDSDTLNIYQGATLKGNVEKVEAINFYCNDSAYAGNAMLENADLELLAAEDCIINLNIADGLTGTFTIYKGAKGSVNENGCFGGIKLNISNGVSSTLQLNLNQEYVADSEGLMKYKLVSDGSSVKLIAANNI